LTLYDNLLGRVTTIKETSPEKFPENKIFMNNWGDKNENAGKMKHN
jgi:hypothetical protein